MNGKDLLLGLSYIDRKFIDESETDTVTAQSRPFRRPLLIAAIIALMLLLVGCAVVYVLSLRELRMGEYHFTQTRYIDAEGSKVPETEVTREVISLQGLAGSPSFLAAQEWLEFEQSYDPDHVHLNEADANPIEVPSDYDAYFVYTQEMVDKVNEIVAKYGLQLAGETVGVQDYETDIFFDSLGINQLHRAGADIQYRSGYFYACGNFNMEFTLTMPNGAKSISGSYRHNGKAYFDTVFSHISSAEECEEWVYATPDGQEVLIVTDDSWIRVFCDREDAFLSLHLNKKSALTQEEIEAIVDCFDFSVTPQKPDMEETRRKLEASFEAYKAEQEARMATYVDPFRRDYESYDDVIRFILDGEYADIYLYALRDITGDGIEELFLGRDGSFGTIKTIADGKPTTLWSNGTDEGLELCEGNILRYQNGAVYHFSKLDSATGQLVSFLQAGYDPWEESWYYIEGGNTDMTYISRTEYDALLATYPVIDIGLKPIREYPFE